MKRGPRSDRWNGRPVRPEGADSDAVDDALELLAEVLAGEAQERIEAGTFGVVGGVLAPDGNIDLFDSPPGAMGPDSPAEAWGQVQRWVSEVAASCGGLALNLSRTEPSDDGLAYEVAVEGREGRTIDFFQPYRRKRLRGWDFSAGRIYTEPDERNLSFE